MPNYDYICDKCGHEEEIFQNMSADPVNLCPKCKSKKFRRLIGAGAGIVFKGTGFYETDYKSGLSDKKEATGEAKQQPKKQKSTAKATA